MTPLELEFVQLSMLHCDPALPQAERIAARLAGKVAAIEPHARRAAARQAVVEYLQRLQLQTVHSAFVAALAACGLAGHSLVCGTSPSGVSNRPPVPANVSQPESRGRR